MIHSRPFSHDPRTGITETFHFDDLTEDVTIETTQVSHLDDVNKAEFNEHSDYGPSRWKGDMHRVGSVPPVIMNELIRQGIWQDGKALLAWLARPENEVFRRKPGRLL